MRSTNVNWFAVGAILILCFTLSAAAAPRETTLIDDGWRFFRGDAENAEAQSFDDKKWESVTIPHTWNAGDAFDEQPGFYRGPGWYRRDLDVGKVAKDERFFLFFEGANQVADVYVNGKKAGNHTGGYTAFSYDITDLLLSEGKNVIAVRVDNSFNQNTPPLTADFTFYGGMYRDVWLIGTGDLHFHATDHAAPGVKITTPNIASGNGTVDIIPSVRNDSDLPRNVQVVASVTDASGREVAAGRKSVTIEPHANADVLGIDPVVASPQLWSPDSPYLYQVKVTIHDKGKTLDEVTQPLGFRWYKFDADAGFSINGKHLDLRGTNRHQDYKDLGNAVPNDLHVRDMQLIKDEGFNFVRLAHYPQDPAVLDAADRLGILLWEEIPVVNYITKSQEFTENAAGMLQDMIRQHRDHPAIILWGYMNEIYLRVPKDKHELYPATVELAKRLNQIAHDEDPTRPTTMACNGSELYNIYGLADVPDVIGWNLYLGWYGGTMDGFGKYLDDQHKRFPKRPMIVSEYGGNGDLRLHSLEPRRFDSTAEYQRMFHESYLAQIEARPYLSGTTLWSEFDFGSEYRGETIPHVNQKGMLTYDRKPKDVYYLYQAALSPKPVVHIAAHDWTYRAGVEKKVYPIDVYSNQPEVELFANGTSQGKKPVVEHKASWNIPMHNGVNRLEAEAKGSADTVEINYRVATAALKDISVNAGSNADFIDSHNNVWLADQAYTKGSWGFVGDASKWIYSDSNDKDILSTNDDPLYQTMREGMTAYKFDVPDGTYQVQLLFAETKFDTRGKRVFTVTINGQDAASDLDLFSAIGARIAFSKTFTIKAEGGTGIVLDFTAKTGQPVISGIRIQEGLGDD